MSFNPHSEQVGLTEPFLSPHALALRTLMRRPPQANLIERGLLPAAVVFWLTVVLHFWGPDWFIEWRAAAWTFVVGYVWANLRANKIAQLDLNDLYQDYLQQFSRDQLEFATKASDQIYDARFIDAVRIQLKRRAAP